MSSYSIGEVAERCGINPVTLRAWQRRYGLLKPQRTEGGHRLFDEEDIQRIEEIKALIKGGTSVGKIKALLEAEKPVPADDCNALQENLMAVLRLASPAKLRAKLVTLRREHTVPELIDNIINPVRQRLTLDNQTGKMLSGMFDGILTELVAASLNESRRKSGKEALIMAWDIEDRIGLWLEAWRLSLQGLHLTVIPEFVSSPRPELFPGQTLYVWTGKTASIRQTELLQYWSEQGYAVNVHNA
ncbi:TPA: MerR family transcriptional regulator [Kluyvera ascorbata]|nr:MerR family transcriptional regulator [Kluyvera ascorbata]